MKRKDIILSGVGGQGILTIAAVIGEAALSDSLFIKQAEVHGMSQRGGDVQSNLRISDEPVYSDLIARGCADVIISLEPMEALRYAHYLAPEGWIITGSVPLVNITNYPDAEAVYAALREYKRLIMIDADAIAKENGTPNSANMVILGAASTILEIDYHKLENGVREVFSRKGDAVVEANLSALLAGYEAAAKR